MVAEGTASVPTLTNAVGQRISLRRWALPCLAGRDLRNDETRMPDSCIVNQAAAAKLLSAHQSALGQQMLRQCPHEYQRSGPADAA